VRSGTVHAGADSPNFVEEGTAWLVRAGLALRVRSGASKLFTPRTAAHDYKSSFFDGAVSTDRCAFPFATSRS